MAFISIRILGLGFQCNIWRTCVRSVYTSSGLPQPGEFHYRQICLAAHWPCWTISIPPCGGPSPITTSCTRTSSVCFRRELGSQGGTGFLPPLTACSHISWISKLLQLLEVGAPERDPDGELVGRSLYERNRNQTQFPVTNPLLFPKANSILVNCYLIPETQALVKAKMD